MNNIVLYGPVSRENEIKDFFRFFGGKEFYRNVDVDNPLFAGGASSEDGIICGIYLFSDIHDAFVNETAIHLPDYTLEPDSVSIMYFLQTREDRAKAKFDKINTQINNNRKHINELQYKVGGDTYYTRKGLAADNNRLKKAAKRAFTDYYNIYSMKQRLIHSMTAEEFNKFYKKFCEYIRKRR